MPQSFKKETPAQVCCCEFWEIFKNNVLQRTPSVANFKNMACPGTLFYIFFRLSSLQYWYGEKNNNTDNNTDSNDNDNQKYILTELLILNLLKMKTLNFFWFCDLLVIARELVIPTSNSAALNCPKNIFRRAFPRRNTMTNAWM